jgi:ABC-type branched-subunit amino acid transport system ATPase component
MDIPAPKLERETRTMKEVMTLAQLDKSSGVFSFPEEDVEALRKGKLVLMVKIGATDLQFSREIFVKMTVQEVLSLTDINPVTLTLYMKKAADSPSFDLF